MFNLQEAYSNITLDDILSRVSEEDLWRHYCPNFKKLDVSFKSDLYSDRNASCRIFRGSRGLIYKDFGTDESYTPISYVMRRYQCDFKEALNIIANDFKIKSSPIKYTSKIIEYNTTPVFKSTIDIVPQGYTIADYEYWRQYCIPLDVLDSEEVISCKTVYLTTSNGVFRYDYTPSNPIYAFKEYDIDKNFLGYKIYFPLAPKGRKWMNSSSDRAIQGIQSIGNDKDLIILTKARKDCICYKILGIKAIAPYNETCNLDPNGINDYMNTFPNKFVNYDNDEKGIKESLQINIKYRHSYFFIDKEKDLSDYIKKYGLEKARKMIETKTDGIYTKT